MCVLKRIGSEKIRHNTGFYQFFKELEPTQEVAFLYTCKHCHIDNSRSLFADPIYISHTSLSILDFLYTYLNPLDHVILPK